MAEQAPNLDASAAIAHPSLFPAYRALMGTGLACAILIVSVFYATKPIIDAKKQAQLETAIFKVLPGTRGKKEFYLTAEGKLIVPDQASTSIPADATKLYAGFDSQGQLVGVAVMAQGIGYADTIRVLYGYKSSSETISGLQVLESKETPGLGDKIEKDPAFVANFEKLDASLSSDKTKLANPIIAVKQGEKTQPWQIDGITGATISSDAIASILHISLSSLLPHLHSQLGQLKYLGKSLGNSENTNSKEAQR